VKARPKEKRMLRHILLLGLIPLLWSIAPATGWGTEPIPAWSWRLVDEGRHVYRYDMDQLNWRQIRRERALRQDVQEQPKHLELLQGWLSEPFATQASGSDVLPAGTLLIRDPDGTLRQPPIGEGMREVVLPEDLGLNGRYLVGGHFVLGRRDLDGDGRPETLHLYPKLMTGHYKNDGRPGASPAFFFNDPDLALEIGPALSPAQHRMGGTMQRPHERYEMEVRYRGRPLAGVTVEAVAEGNGWRKNFRTDALGRFTIVPFDDRSGERHYEKLLYLVSYQDRDEQAMHIATLPMIVYRNRPEWTSHLAGYAVWTILGLGGGLLLTIGAVLRRRRLRHLDLTRFSQCRIKED
jgi:hypothetical protein